MTPNYQLIVMLFFYLKAAVGKTVTEEMIELEMNNTRNHNCLLSEALINY